MSIVTEYRGSSACSTWFKATVREASRRQAGISYRTVGYKLAESVASFGPYDQDEAFWEDRLQELDNLTNPRPGDGPDDDQVWNWFKSNLPRCMRLVPSERKAIFLEGVYQHLLENSVFDSL